MHACPPAPAKHELEDLELDEWKAYTQAMSDPSSLLPCRTPESTPTRALGEINSQ